ncbi:hypothetical protein GIS00_17095 [Nakamurella sp. YIM 132087]|uniref:Tetratricopeptide repeat protein n=1 Tax=Nakamurella alba TaxID=2665158 RepID=A0A7K1FNA9_9ACTN|nr:hypothetical protein [Nakamurella alba]MTD15652.1 hypothetical protein [Nakamurella alba]
MTAIPEPAGPSATGTPTAMQRIAAGIGLGQRGQTTEARLLLSALWAEIGPEGPPLQRLSVAHALADVQEEVTAELEWDLVALQVASRVTDAEVAAAGMPGNAAALYPSLHLNAGEAHRRCGDDRGARRHLDLGRTALHELPVDVRTDAAGYLDMIEDGLRRLEQRLADPASSLADSGIPPHP